MSGSPQLYRAFHTVQNAFHTKTIELKIQYDIMLQKNEIHEENGGKNMKTKSIFKSFAALALAIVVLLGAMPSGAYGFVPKAAALDSDFMVGDIISFGSYPQQIVTDETLISALDAEAKNWVSYGYYSGTDGETVGSMVSGDWMQYADITYNDEKYRAVVFYLYMPDCTYDEASENYGYSTQKENGYKINEVYYFKYEPIQWNVLDPGSGLVICDSIIDSQPYSEKLYEDYFGEECYNDAGMSIYANYYAASSIREWLNDDFYNTAFSDFEKECITISGIENAAFDAAYDKYSGETTNDNVFLLSFDEVKNSAYGFTQNNTQPSLLAYGSDYAKCQGLWVDEDGGMSPWYLRTAAEHSAFACSVDSDGDIDTGDDGMVSSNELGIRPALRISSLDIQDGSANGNTVWHTVLIIALACVGTAALVAVLIILFKKTFAK